MKKKNSRGKGSQSLAKHNTFSRSTALAKFKPKKKNPAKSGGSILRFRNPLSRFSKIGGVSVVDIFVGGVTTLVVQGISVVLPGTDGSWMRILSQAGVVIGMVYLAPNSIKTPVAIGGGAVPVMGAVNKLTNNAISNFIGGVTQSLLPAGNPNPAGTGRMGAIYAVPPGFARYN